MHDNYEQTNGIQLEFFLHKSYAGIGILQQTEWGISTIKHQNFEFKNWKKEQLKNVRIWSFLNVEGSNLLIDIHRHKLM